MSESPYPILVERYQGTQPVTIVCERCHAEGILDPDDINQDDLYECPADTERGRTASIEPRCMGHACMKYVEADRCPGCRKLGFWEPSTLSGCCSRRCMLQAEYAASLGVRS